MITLYDYAPSPHCVRVRIALALGDVKYKKVSMTLEGDQEAPAFRKLSPRGTVPVLVDGKVAVAESYAALIWLGEKVQKLLPKAEEARARVLTFVAMSATELDPPLRRAYEGVYFTEEPKHERVVELFDDLTAALDRFEQARASSPKTRYAASESPSIADAAIFPSWWLLQDLAGDFPKKLSLKKWPLWQSWYAAMGAIAGVRAVVEEAAAEE